MRKGLKTDLPDFQKFDDDLNEAKVQELKAAEDAAYSVGTHDEFKGQSKILTKKVNAALGQCWETFEALRYFLKKKFKGEDAFIKQFGFSKFSRVRNNQDEMVLFFNTLARVVEKNRETLVSKGMDESLLDSIKPVGEQLKEANTEQDAFLNSQPTDTVERVTTFNALYDVLAQFSDAAGIVYKNRSDKRSFYTIPRNGPASDDDEDIDSDESENEGKNEDNKDTE